MGGRIDLNTATARDVAALPGVDPLLARRIIVDRRLYGPFRSPEDVTRVEGFSTTLFTSLADRIDVSLPEGGLPATRLIVEQIGEIGDAPKPIVFAGPPGSLSGSFVLRNDGDAMLQASLLRLESDTLRTPDGAPLGRLAIGVALPPGERKRVVVRLRVDPLRPPGSYEATLVAGEKRYPVTILVTEQLATVLSPPNLVLPTVAGKYERRLIVRNDGNVSLTIDDIGVLFLEDADLPGQAFRGTLLKTDHPKLDDLIGTVVDELKRNSAELGPLLVRTTNKPIRVEPGGNALLILEAEVPQNLPRRRNFVATIPIRDATLRFQLVSSLQLSPTPSPATARRSRGEADRR
jgi:Helix-hairpin-helix motif